MQVLSRVRQSCSFTGDSQPRIPDNWTWDTDDNLGIVVKA